MKLVLKYINGQEAKMSTQLISDTMAGSLLVAASVFALIVLLN